MNDIELFYYRKGIVLQLSELLHYVSQDISEGDKNKREQMYAQLIKLKNHLNGDNKIEDSVVSNTLEILDEIEYFFKKESNDKS